MPVTRVCQHSQELKSGPLANIYKQEINTQFRIRYIGFTDTGIVRLLHSYREFHEDIPRNSCPQQRHDNCQYGHSHFTPSIKKKLQEILNTSPRGYVGGSQTPQPHQLSCIEFPGWRQPGLSLPSLIPFKQLEAACEVK